MFDTAELADKYQTMTRAHDRGAKDGHQNIPSEDATSLSEAELEISQLAQDDLNRYAAEQNAANDETREKIRSLRSELSSNPLLNIDTFKTRSELKLIEVERELVRLQENLLSRQQDYRYFKTYHHLDREADPPSSPFDVFALLIFLIAVDGALNAFFFMDSNPYGLVGGMLMAAVISVLNTGSGFGLGVLPWRYLLHRNRLHRIWAFPLLCIGLVGILLLNFAVGHYRDLLLASKDAEPPQIIAPMLHSTFMLQTLQSYLLTGLGIFIAMYSAYKGYTIFDPYPGYGKRYKRLENAKDEFESKLRQIQKEIIAIAKAYIDEINVIFNSANMRVQECINSIDETISRNTNYGTIFTGIEDACNSAIRTYRKANLQVRDTARHPAPTYFSNNVSLQKVSIGATPDELEKAKQDLMSISVGMRNDFEEIARQVPTIERELLSEKALNDRLARVKETAMRTHRENIRAQRVGEALSSA